MPASQGTDSFGSQLAVENPPGSGTFANLLEVLKISGPGIEITQTELTNLNSPSRFDEWTSGIGRGGEITFDINAVASTISTLYGYIFTTRAWQVIWPLVGSQTTPSRWQSNGQLKAMGEEIPEPGGSSRITCPITIKTTGKPSFTVGS